MEMAEDVNKSSLCTMSNALENVDNGHKQAPLLPTLFLKLPGCEDHVDNASVLLKSTLRCRQH